LLNARQASSIPQPQDQLDQIVETLHLLQQQCQQVQQHMDETRERLSQQASVLENGEGVDDGKKSTRIKVLEAKVKRYEAEIKQLKSGSLELEEDLVSNPALAKARVKEELIRVIAEHDTAIQQLNISIEKERELLIREKQIHAELIELNKALESKIAKQIESENPAKVKQDEMKTMRAKWEVLTKSNATITKQLVQFMDTYYPEVTGQSNKKRRKPLDSYFGSSQKQAVDIQYTDLKTIVQDLINKCTLAPENPYLVCKPEYYPPYIELLIRSGIAVKCPDDSTLIKLTDFHL